MKKNSVILIVFLLCFALVFSASAQLLDDEEQRENTTLDASDELFEEMFSDFSETEKDITKVKTFDDAIDKISEELKKRELPAVEEPEVVKITPLQGIMYVGIQKNSFKIFQDMSGRTKCSFAVALKPDIDKDIKLLAFNLIYSKKVFSFIFKDANAKKTHVRRITTSGEICYSMAGIVPDIGVHICKIKGTLASDCIKHMKWSDDLE